MRDPSSIVFPSIPCEHKTTKVKRAINTERYTSDYEPIVNHQLLDSEQSFIADVGIFVSK
jgi:hypothetical protein